MRHVDDAEPGTTLGFAPGVIDFTFPPPEPAPLTTIAWRLGHVIAVVFGERNARYFDGPAMDHRNMAYPLTADAALDEGQARWRAGAEGLTDEALQLDCREPGFESDSMADLPLHIHREVIHHGAEIGLLRDLCLRRERLG